ncbi:hypothetical protein RSOLAG22IIIB_00027 [Rhizoctonia solani]|uniref:Uncharacterized protein n=1 Tax=Rhizoctonia solani TaxID=456999 RepID=A0A0K6FKC8_9AGAM|nr:hypothetical protein RSOLAG22IIIB_00027 [Rhizoctonia solani]
MEASANSNNKDNALQLLQALERRIAQQDKYFNQLNERLERMEKRIELCGRTAYARTSNSNIRGFRQPLHPISLPNGDDVPKGQFPLNQGDFFELTDQSASNLIALYGLVIPDGVPESTGTKLKILADHIGLPW